jgi:hypothetical protein
MVVLSAGPAGSEAISRDWPAEAGLCDSPSRLLVKSEQPGAGGTLLVLQLPDHRVTTYPVALANRGTSPPPVAMVGIQVYSKTGPLAYQATEGAVELTALGETVGGRFGLTVREVNRHDQLRYAGSFREIPVARLDSARCVPSVPSGAPQH